MARRASRLSARLAALAPPAAGALALAAALAALVAGFGLSGPLVVSAPGQATSGVGLVLALDPANAGVLAALLAGGGAALLAAPRLLPSIAMLAAAAGAVLAGNDHTRVVAALIVLLLARHARTAEPLALAALPVVLVALARVTGLHDAEIVAGAAVLVAGFLYGALAGNLGHLARGMTLGLAGLALLAVGLHAMPAARLALETAALTGPVLALSAREIEAATGTSAPDWLGGLARGMPRFSACLAGGLGFASLLPPGPGFGAFRDVFQSATHAGAWQGGLAATSLAAGFALSGFAALRGFGITCLGRPRSLRAAAAEDVPRRIVLALGIPVVCGVALALWQAPFAVLVPAAVITVFAIRARRAGPIEAPPFEDGFASPPAWLPFGDPATQINATGFAAPLAAAMSPLMGRLAAVARARSGT